MERYLSRDELFRQMRRFLDDENRTISVNNFATMCGYDVSTINKVFGSKSEPCSIAMQIRASKVLEAMRLGELRIMQSPVDKKRRVEYRPGGQQLPRMARGIGLSIVGGQIKLKPGIVNRGDYSRPGLDELMEE